MPASVKSIINQAYQLTGALDNDEAADGQQNAIAVMKLNQVLSQLNLDQQFPYSRKIVTHQVTSPNEYYTIGDDVAYDIADVRPSFINRILYASSAEGQSYNVQQLDLPDLLTMRSSSSSIGSPCYFSYNPEYPAGKIYFDIKPTAGGILTIVYNSEIATVDINDTMNVPNEYTEVLVTTLAVVLAVNDQMPADTIQNVTALRDATLNRLESANSRGQVPVFDISLDAVHNIYTG